MTFQTNFPLYPTKLPYITVSAKGISNGLSDIPNDGFDFGPDTLLGTFSKGQYGPPYTQTSGIQEAFNYATTIARADLTGSNNNGYILPPVHLLSGEFILNADFNLPLFTNNPQAEIPSFVLEGEGGNFYQSGTTIKINGYNFTIGSSGQNQNSNGGFVIRDVGFTNSGNVNGNVNFNGFYAGNNAVISNVGLNCPLYMNNAEGFYELLLENVATSYQIALPDTSTIITLNSVWSAIGTYITNSFGYNPQITQIEAPSLGEGLIIDGNNINAEVHIGTWSVDLNNNGNTGVYAIYNLINPGYTSELNLVVENLTLSQGTSSSYANFWGNFVNIQGTLKLKLHIKNLILNGYENFTLPSSGLEVLQFEIDEITNISGQSLASLPIYISANGTTAGTISGRYTNYRTNYKKIIFTFTGYENNTTTNQTINFPLPFSSYAIITGNNTGLTISATTSAITITSPNSTTTYSGIVIVEGY